MNFLASQMDLVFFIRKIIQVLMIIRHGNKRGVTRRIEIFGNRYTDYNLIGVLIKVAQLKSQTFYFSLFRS